MVGHLIEEHILPVSPFRCKLLDDPLRADAMLGTQLLPELKTDCRQTGEATVVYILNRRAVHISPRTTVAVQRFFTATDRQIAFPKL